MKKAFGVGLVCSVAILSSCSLFEDEKKTLADEPRTAPILNSGGGYMPVISPAVPIDTPMPMAANGMAPTPPVPPQFPNDPSYMPLPNAIPAPEVASRPLTPPALPGQQGNNAPVLLASASDTAGMNLSSPVPPAPPIAPMPMAAAPALPMPPAPPAALPSERRAPEFNRTVLNQISADQSKANEYPKLAQVPPAPPIPTSVDNDPRVQAMRDELASLEGPGAAPITPVIVSKTEIREGMAVPSAPVASMPLPPAPPLAVPPAPPGYSAPPATTSLADLKPLPPVPGAKPATTSVTDLRPVGAPGAAMPPAPFPPAPPAFTPPPAPASTSVADLRPLPVSTLGTAPAPMMADAPAAAFTNPDHLVPLSGGTYKTLPDSRYAKYRASARNSTRPIVR